MGEATKRWIAGQENPQRKRGKVPTAMAPWDENAYFDLPIERGFTTTGGVADSVAKANPRRVVLLFSLASASSYTVSTRSDIAGAGNGIIVNNTTLPLVITQANHGPLCQVEWFAFTAVPLLITIIEINLREWPL